jgi:hypothetical protein
MSAVFMVSPRWSTLLGSHLLHDPIADHLEDLGRDGHLDLGVLGGRARLTGLE